jgi:phenylalanyl-tRNA synthetase alpha chain
MKQELKQLKERAIQALDDITDRDGLEDLRTEILGRKGEMSQLMRQMADLEKGQRAEVGKLANEVKTAIQDAFSEIETEIEKREEVQRIEDEWVDITEPGDWPEKGHLHPVSQAIFEISDIFEGVGFTRVRMPEIDWDYYAFESLNMPKDHPARDDWETFFVKETATQAATGEKGKIVLTPHTSNSQVRHMEECEPPIRMVNINRTYRRQSDVSHTPMFHQFEGLMIDEGVTVAHLKGVLERFAKQYFGPDRRIRLRPHHFRFTEPSFEIDISCDICGGEPDASCRLCKSGWLELGGAGMVHPNVLTAGGLDPEVYTGFAFGWGVERTLMMRSGASIADIRTLYRNDLRFVEQF